jgi:hypothetical protein
MRHLIPAHPRLWLAIVGITTATVVAPILPAGSATAQSEPSVCVTSGHAAAATQIMTRSQTMLTGIESDIAWTQDEFDRAASASPAKWRLREELDRLKGESESLRDLAHVAFVRGDATSGSPAQFRAQEELDQLCSEIAQDK